MGPRRTDDDASGERLQVRLPGSALGRSEECKDLDRLVSDHTQLHGDARFDAGALTSCHVHALPIARGELDRPFEYVEALGPAMGVGRGTSPDVHRDVPELE